MATSGSTKFESLRKVFLRTIYLFFFLENGRLEGEVGVFGKKHVIFVISLGAASGTEITHFNFAHGYCISLVHVYIYINNGIFLLAH